METPVGCCYGSVFLFPQLNKGTEITLKATPTTNILDIRGKLAQRTNIAKDSIQIRYRVSSLASQGQSSFTCVMSLSDAHGKGFVGGGGGGGGHGLSPCQHCFDWLH